MNDLIEGLKEILNTLRSSADVVIIIAMLLSLMLALMLGYMSFVLLMTLTGAS